MSVSYNLDFTPAARRDLKRLSKGVQRKIAVVIDALADEPRPHGYEKIEGSKDVYRVRCGDYRVLYQIIEDSLMVLVVRARHRREAYKHISDPLKRLP